MRNDLWKRSLHVKSARNGIVSRTNGGFEIEAADERSAGALFRWFSGCVRIPISQQRRSWRRSLLLLNISIIPAAAARWKPLLHCESLSDESTTALGSLIALLVVRKFWTGSAPPETQLLATFPPTANSYSGYYNDLSFSLSTFSSSFFPNFQPWSLSNRSVSCYHHMETVPLFLPFKGRFGKLQE